MIFLCYPKCSTCQKAQKWLEANGASYELRNIKDDKPTEAELRAWHNLSCLPLKKFFNTSGLLYKLTRAELVSPVSAPFRLFSPFLS